MATYVESLNKLTRQYNDAIQALEDSYDMESSQSYVLNRKSSELLRQYSNRYKALQQEYIVKRHELWQAWKQANPIWARNRTLWGWVFVVGIIAAMVCCTANMPDEVTPVDPAMVVSDENDITYWDSENIPIPHLQDASQYVSNPDNVLSQSAVDRMNATLQRLDSELGIESVVIVVNHIKNDDPFRMAQDVGNKYGVGRQDRGLVVIVGYEDHSINMSPGRSLEGDLTDAECHRLEQQYVVPAMKAEQPDSGMIYLTEAIYATLQNKQLPQMSSLTSQSDEMDEEVAAAIGFTFLFLLAWGILFLYLNRKYQWLALLGAIHLTPDPFYQASSIYIGGGGGGFGGGGFGGGSFGGGGGFSGGSFGGGSFGGGGATSRW